MLCCIVYGLMTRKKSLHGQYRFNNSRPNYIVNGSNNTTFQKKRTFNSWLVGSVDTEPTDTSGQLYKDVSLGKNVIGYHFYLFMNAKFNRMLKL